MKKAFPLILLSVAAFAVEAQEPADALRASWTVASGTARQQAIGGAMGSLGGDVTATFVNPAGLAFYRTGDVLLSPSFRFGKNSYRYLGREEKERDQKFTFGTSGFVIAADGHSSKVKSSALSIAFNTTGDFKNNVLYRGVNNQSSYSQKYLEELRNGNIKDGNVAANDFPFGTSLAFNTLLIDTVGGSTNGAFQFQSRAANVLGTGLLQEQQISNKGGIYETALGLAVNYNDKWLLGGSLGLPYLHYRREASFTEADATSNVNNKFDFATFSEELTSKGLGFNAKVGVIYKPQEFWRLGLAVHSPTIYSITDNYESSVTANVEGAGTGTTTDYSVDYNNGEPFEAKYTMITPYRVMGSISYVLREIQDVTKQRGFLTADVEYVNYKASSFHPIDNEEVETPESTKDYLKTLNKSINNTYKGAFNFRAGGELKFTTVMFRLGAAYYGNPYKNLNGEKGSKLNLSGGLGYRNKGFFIDVTYVHSTNRDTHIPYRLSASDYPSADVRTTAGNVLLTVGVKI